MEQVAVTTKKNNKEVRRRSEDELTSKGMIDRSDPDVELSEERLTRNRHTLEPRIQPGRG